MWTRGVDAPRGGAQPQGIRLDESETCPTHVIVTDQETLDALLSDADSDLELSPDWTSEAVFVNDWSDRGCDEDLDGCEPPR